MLKTIPLHNSKTLCAVKVPENAHSFEIYDKESLPLALMYYVTQSGIHFPTPVIIPPGNWRILALATELNDEQKKEVIQGNNGGENDTMFMDYSMPKDYFAPFTCRTVNQSYFTFLAATKLYSENPFGYPTETEYEGKDWRDEVIESDIKAYNEAQQHVGRWLLLIKGSNTLNH